MEWRELLIELLPRTGILIDLEQLELRALPGASLPYIARKQNKRRNGKQNRMFFADGPMLTASGQSDVPKTQKAVGRVDIGKKALTIAVLLFSKITAAEKIRHQLLADAAFRLQTPRRTAGREGEISNTGQRHDLGKAKQPKPAEDRA